MKDLWVVLGVDLDVAGYDAMPRFNTETEAVACAQTHLDLMREYQRKHHTGMFGATGSRNEISPYGIVVAKVVYEAVPVDVKPAEDRMKELRFDWQHDYQLQKVEL